MTAMLIHTVVVMISCQNRRRLSLILAVVSHALRKQSQHLQRRRYQVYEEASANAHSVSCTKSTASVTGNPTDPGMYNMRDMRAERSAVSKCTILGCGGTITCRMY